MFGATVQRRARAGWREFRTKLGLRRQRTYWERRQNARYLQEVLFLSQSVASMARSLVDVGTNGCPYLEWFDWIPRKISIDISQPYQSSSVQGIKTDFLTSPIKERFDLCLCLQTLEHVPDPEAFARKLLAVSTQVIISVPYLWPEGMTQGHIHDPIDEAKLGSWFGRPPDKHSIVTEKRVRTRSRRIVALYTG